MHFWESAQKVSLRRCQGNKKITQLPLYAETLDHAFKIVFHTMHKCLCLHYLHTVHVWRGLCKRQTPVTEPILSYTVPALTIKTTTQF